jgi:hypothetical protein
MRTFLIICTLPVPLLTWLANVKISAVKQRAAIAQLEAKGIVHVRCVEPTPFLPTRLVRSLVDRDAFNVATAVYVDNQNKRFTRRIFNEADLIALTHLDGLRDLWLMHRSQMRKVDHQQDRVDLPQPVLANLATIRSLCLLSIDADFDPETQLKLARLPEIHSLHLPGTQVTNETLEALGQSDKISSLDIDASVVTAKGLEGLAKAPVLQTLILRQLPSNRQLLGALTQCKALTHLQMHSSRLTVEDAKFINELPIQSISLFQCELEPGFLLSLENSRSLVKLRILGTRRDDGLHSHFDGNLDKLAACEDRFAMKALSKTPTDQTSP